MFRYLYVCIILFARGLQGNNSYVDPENHSNAHLLPDTCGDSKERRISESPTADLYEYPWMARISYETLSGLDFQCTGTIINSRYILTAANCVNDKIAGVRVGEYNQCTSTDCQGVGETDECESHIQDIRVEDQKVHEDFTSKPHVNNNIALLRLKDPIDFSFKNVAPVCLPISNKLRNISVETATLASWRSRQREEVSCVLYKINLPIVTRNECLKKYERFASSEIPRIGVHQLCADEQAQDACGIVSGDPLMVDTEHQGARRIVQYGLSSHGPIRCGSSFPGVYTDISKYVNWILSNIKE